MQRFIFLTSFWITFFLFFSLEAAAPAFHVYIAEKWVERFEKFSEEEKKSFLVGTLFPDIRYLGVISRENTHEKGVTLEDLVSTKDPFLKGKRLHAFVDDIRNELLKHSDISDLLEEIPKENQVSFLKFLEDAVLFDQNDWSFILHSLDTFTLSEEYGVPSASLSQWHTILKHYFYFGPAHFLSLLGASHRGCFGISPQLIKDSSLLIPEYSQKEEFQRYVSHLLEEFQKILK